MTPRCRWARAVDQCAKRPTPCWGAPVSDGGVRGGGVSCNTADALEKARGQGPPSADLASNALIRVLAGRPARRRPRGPSVLGDFGQNPPVTSKRPGASLGLAVGAGGAARTDSEWTHRPSKRTAYFRLWAEAISVTEPQFRIVPRVTTASTNTILDAQDATEGGRRPLDWEMFRHSVIRSATPRLMCVYRHPMFNMIHAGPPAWASASHAGSLTNSRIALFAGGRNSRWTTGNFYMGTGLLSRWGDQSAAGIGIPGHAWVVASPMTPTRWTRQLAPADRPRVCGPARAVKGPAFRFSAWRRAAAETMRALSRRRLSAGPPHNTGRPARTPTPMGRFPFPHAKRVDSGGVGGSAG